MHVGKQLLFGSALALALVFAVWTSRPEHHPVKRAVVQLTKPDDKVLTSSYRTMPSLRVVPDIKARTALTDDELRLPEAMRPSPKNPTPVTDMMPKVPHGQSLYEGLPERPAPLAYKHESEALYALWEREAGLSAAQRAYCRRVVQEIQWLRAQALANPVQCEDRSWECARQVHGYQESLRERFLLVLDHEQWAMFLDTFTNTTMFMLRMEGAQLWRPETNLRQG